MKTKLLGLLAGLLLGLAFITLSYGNAWAHAADAFDTETDYDRGYSIYPYWGRDSARTYARSAVGEMYRTLGGWWIDNNVEDPFDGIKGYEGVDCSGLVFKSWALPHVTGGTGQWYWNYEHDVHGPYQASAFNSGCSGACSTICNGPCGGYSLAAMDAFASSTHVALFNLRDGGGHDWVIEALSPGYTAVEHINDSFRNSSSYKGIRRSGW
jgi:hypothetical protein